MSNRINNLNNELRMFINKNMLTISRWQGFIYNLIFPSRGANISAEGRVGQPTPLDPPLRSAFIRNNVCCHYFIEIIAQILDNKRWLLDVKTWNLDMLRLAKRQKAETTATIDALERRLAELERMKQLINEKRLYLN